MNDAHERKMIYVTPCEGRTVHDPLTEEQLPAVGMWVQSASYWYRLQRDKDVTISKSEPKPAKAKA